jgi:hypothetical protein
MRGRPPQLCPHGILGKSKCRKCKTDTNRSYDWGEWYQRLRANPIRLQERREKVNAQRRGMGYGRKNNSS